MYVALIWFVLHLGLLGGSSCCLLSTGFFGGSAHTKLHFLSLVVLVCSGFDVCPDDGGASYRSDLVHLVTRVFCSGMLFRRASLRWNFVWFSGHNL
jgi:hypothetical protein